jgi:hypothetical protein
VAFTAPTDGEYRISLDAAGTDFDTVLAVFDGCGGAELACNDFWAPSEPNGGEEVLVDLVAGQTVIALVEAWGTEAGTFTLQVEQTVACTDPDCVEIAWSNVVTTPSTCFTFSSPTLIGDEAIATVAGSDVTLDFEVADWDAVFTGTQVGTDLTLTNVTLFPFGLDDWQVTETMTGTVSGTTVAGTYLYTECDATNDPASCPADGGCEVTADFTFDLP